MSPQSRFVLDTLAGIRVVSPGAAQKEKLRELSGTGVKMAFDESKQSRVGKGSPEGGQFGSGGGGFAKKPSGGMFRAELETLSDDELDGIRKTNNDKGTRQTAKKILKERGVTIVGKGKIVGARQDKPSKGKVFSDPREVAASEDAELSSERDAIADILEESGAELNAESDSGSRYYTLKGGRQIRVSDHPPNAATKNWIEENNVLSVLLGTGGGIAEVQDALKNAT